MSVEPAAPVPSLDAASLSLVRTALAEDVGAGDVTTLWTVPADAAADAEIVARKEGVVAGLELAMAVFRELDPAVRFSRPCADGERAEAGRRVLGLSGKARAILTGERTALNFLQRLSGIASLTRRFVDAVQGTGCRILDTRKTTPGWRALEKAAVVAGGGVNHRAGLYDRVLIKENHIAVAGGIAAALDAVARHNADDLPVEIEVRDLEELEQALTAGARHLLLDNMSTTTLRAAVARARQGGGSVVLEASGTMSLDRVAAVAAAGVDHISVGALTHSAPALDLSLLVRIR